jgi:toxin-antitoxin system PIN domain toxin
MLLIDVNVLVHAYRSDAPEHPPYRDFLEALVNGEAAYATSDIVLSGFLRVVTHPRVFSPPSPLEHALGFAEAFRGQPNATPVAPGPRHWAIFANLCRTAGAKGNLVPDAFLAALAIETGSEWISADRDFARFPGLRWRHPLDV